LFRLHAERAGWSCSQIARASTEQHNGITQIDFVAEAEVCPSCGSELEVQKSKTRSVITANEGAFQAREVVKKCTNAGPNCTPVGSQQLARIVKPRQRYSYDLIVHVGLARYLRRKQRKEIITELMEQRGIKLSSGTVSNLCDRFLVYFERLHVHRAPQLRAAMQGGYPLHMDATCDSGKGGLFICMDGWRLWVLVAGRIPTENEVHIRPFIDETIALFGDPIATVRDMGEGIANAVKPLEQRGIIDLICHYHFLTAVGKKLLETRHHQLSEIIRYSKVRTDLRALLQTLRRYRNPQINEQRFGPGTVREQLLALVLWILESDGKKDAPFPFSMPHLDFVIRCQQSRNQVDKWVPCPRTQPERRCIRYLQGIVNRLERDQRVAKAVQILDDNWQVFSQLRDVLRLSNSELPRGDTRNQPVQLPLLELMRMQQIEKEVAEYIKELEQRASPEQKQKKRPTCPHTIVLNYFERYGKNLFGHPVLYEDDGSILSIVERTNNIAEHFFGDSKQNLRRRLGRAHLSRDLQQQPAQVALVSNLQHADYVRVFCGCVENMPEAFADLDAQNISDASPLFRDHRDKQLRGLLNQLLEQDDQGLSLCAPRQ